MSARRWGCVLLALAQSCATFHERREVSFEETERRPFETRSGGRVALEVARVDAVLRVHVTRTQRCEQGVRISGNETEIIHRQVADLSQNSAPVWWGVAAIFVGVPSVIMGGLGLIAPRAYLCPPAPTDSSGRALGARPPCFTNDDGTVGNSGTTEETARVISGIALGAGVLSMLPSIVDLVRAGDSRRTYEATHTEMQSSHDCAPQPVQTRVTIQGPAGFTREHTTNSDGDADVDLIRELPVQAFEGSAAWDAVDVRVGDTGARQVFLSAVRELMADRAWRSVEQAHDPAEVERFATRFPLDPRASEAHERAERIRAESASVARDHERRTRWLAAGDDPARLSALVAEPFHDAYEANAECRLARLATDVDDMRINVRRCIHAIDGMTPVARDTAPDVMVVAEDIRDAMNARIAEADAAARAEAARVAREAEEAAAREAQRAEAARERQRHQQQQAGRSALAAAASVVSSCRGGHGGCSVAAQAYRALLQGRGVVRASDLRRAVTSVAVACRCTPTQAGTQDPSR